MLISSIHFIVNPIAGNGSNELTVDRLRPYFDDGSYDLVVKNSRFKKQAIQLARESIMEGADIIVACGGDGTINEVASCLVGTSIALGIVPLGSGNGLASNLQIPTVLDKAIQVIKSNNKVKIDVGKINDLYFFSNTGIGFDANVIRNYEASERRTLLGYLGASLKSFKDLKRTKFQEVHISNIDVLISPFMIFISNSNQLGYNISLTPKASLQDGMLDVIIVPEMGWLRMLLFSLLLAIKKPYLLKEVRSFQTKHQQILRKNAEHFDSQIDGELHQIEKDRIDISVMEAALQVIA